MLYRVLLLKDTTMKRNENYKITLYANLRDRFIKKYPFIVPTRKSVWDFINAFPKINKVNDHTLELLYDYILSNDLVEEIGL